MTKTTLMLMDSQSLFRQGLRRIVEADADLEIITEATDPSQIRRLVKKFRPNLVLMNINPPFKNGLKAIRKIKQVLPETMIIVLTTYQDDEQILSSIRAGAPACIPKAITPRHLIEAIRQVLKGRYVINDDVLDKQEVTAWLLQRMKWAA